MDALLQRLEVQPQLAREDDLAVDHAPLRQRRPELLDHLREVAVQRLPVAAVDAQRLAVAEDDGAEAVPLGLVEPALAARDVDLQLGEHGTDRRRDGQHHASAATRCAPAYTFMPPSRRKPTRVMPADSASSTASDDGADTAASSGIPAISAFCASSNEARPDTMSRWERSGSRRSVAAQPITLSTALCRPTSSRRHTSAPESSNSPAACNPPVRSNTRCASRIRPGSAHSTSTGTRIASSRTGHCARVPMASML